MALDQNFKHLDIREALENTHMRGRNITFLDDFPAMKSSLFSSCTDA